VPKEGGRVFKHFKEEEEEMIKKVSLGKEIVLSVVNKIGVLADISKIVTEQGVNIAAVAGYAEKDNTAKIILVTDNNSAVIGALKSAKYGSVEERDALVVELENKAGALKAVTEKLSRGGIDIKQIYGTNGEGGGSSKIVLSTSDNKLALESLKK